ncbi:SH3 domain-containing protein [Streptomyces odonnellii]|uniref:SH3 domain-containing protein n=1 Tax=Streptomyces odonnellii TaxID=1417980 RepID=UPI000B24789D|nr:SH3 domain-containing protein [Streptomyces odonnellii]
MSRPPIKNRAAAALAALALAGCGVLAATTATASTPADGNDADSHEFAAVGPQYGKVVTSRSPLDIRQRPDQESAVLGTVPRNKIIRLACWESGTTYTIPNYAGGNQFWYKIAPGQGYKTGYLTAQYVRVAPNDLDDLPNCHH